MEGIGLMYFVGGVFVLLLAILWFLLPFAVFGTKPKIDELITHAKETNALLRDIRAELRDGDGPVKIPPLSR